MDQWGRWKSRSMWYAESEATNDCFTKERANNWIKYSWYVKKSGNQVFIEFSKMEVIADLEKSNFGEVVGVKDNCRTSLVAQWLRIHLTMQGTRVWALVQEDPTCRGATKPMHHNYWACAPQPLKPASLEPVLRNKRSHCYEKPTHRNEE